MTPALLEPFGRLPALLDEASAIGALAPLIEREIHFFKLVLDWYGYKKEKAYYQKDSRLLNPDN